MDSIYTVWNGDVAYPTLPELTALRGGRRGIVTNDTSNELRSSVIGSALKKETSKLNLPWTA
jgi:hypothetical protein